MDDQELQALATRLESDAPADQARVALRQPDGGPDESFLAGNRAGLLRFAAALLRAAALPADELNQSIVTGDLIESDAAPRIDFVTHTDIWDVAPSETPGDKFRSAAYPIGCVILVVICIIGGVVVVGALNYWLAFGIVGFLVAIAIVGKWLDARDSHR